MVICLSPHTNLRPRRGAERHLLRFGTYNFPSRAVFQLVFNDQLADPYLDAALPYLKVRLKFVVYFVALQTLLQGSL